MRIQESVYALVFASESPVAPSAIADALGVPVFEVEDSLEAIGRKLSLDGPLQLVRIAGGYQLATKPEYAGVVARLLQPQPLKLTRSLMEVLAIVAYRQPVTGADIEGIRGVQSDYSLRQLLEKRLVMEVGRKHAPGRPLLYGTTAQFLHMFNLNSLDELPDLSLLQGDILAIGPREDPAQPGLFSDGEGH
jgi:segregation and condensation protein B